MKFYLYLLPSCLRHRVLAKDLEFLSKFINFCYLFYQMKDFLDVGFAKLSIEAFEVTALLCKLIYVTRMKDQTPFVVYSMY